MTPDKARTAVLAGQPAVEDIDRWLREWKAEAISESEFWQRYGPTMAERLDMAVTTGRTVRCPRCRCPCYASSERGLYCLACDWPRPRR